MPFLSFGTRVQVLLAAGLLAGCSSGDNTGPAVEAPSFDRSVRAATLVITTLPGEPTSDGLRIFNAGNPTVVQVQARDKKGRPLSRIDVTAESVDWAAHWPGRPSPPLDPAAQIVRTDATGTAAFTLNYPSPMLRVVTWRGTAGSATVDARLSIAPDGINPACSDYFGQYTQEQFPECFE
jgi:hypothetical protein